MLQVYLRNSCYSPVSVYQRFEWTPLIAAAHVITLATVFIAPSSSTYIIACNSGRYFVFLSASRRLREAGSIVREGSVFCIVEKAFKSGMGDMSVFPLTRVSLSIILPVYKAYRRFWTGYFATGAITVIGDERVRGYMKSEVHFESSISFLIIFYMRALIMYISGVSAWYAVLSASIALRLMRLGASLLLTRRKCAPSFAMSTVVR